MPEILLENVNHDEPPQEETADAVKEEEEPADSDKDLSEKEEVVEPTPVVMKKPRGRPKGPPKPKPEPKKRGRPPIESNPEPMPSYEAPATWDMAAYNQSLINALVAHSQSSKSQRRAQWSSLVKL